jgi:SAM-dependent methyltransferase
MNKGQSLLDLGCGNGRDSRYFDSEGLFVTALDLIDNGRDADILYVKHDLTEQIDEFGLNRLFDFVYCRFLLHAVPEEVEEYILWESYNLLSADGMLCIEARSDKGTAPDEHYRRLINFDELLLKLCDFEIVYKTEQRGLAVYGEEDPEIIRIICKR